MIRLLLVIIILVSFASRAVEPVDIWRDSIGHCKVQLFPYPAKEKDAPAVIVCPGGSYFWHDMETEGHAVAEWLNRNGIAAFVLKYRVAGIPAFITHYRLLARGNRYPNATTIMNSIYADILGISSVAAGICGSVCLLTLMFSKDQKNVDVSAKWLKRIAICWVGIILMASILRYVLNKTNGMSETTLPTS